jgi:hypothetical protein
MRILERFIKNNTPYLGRLVLRIEKEPEYNDIKKGYLNNIHLNLKFFKIVTRLIPNIKNESLELKDDTIVLIEKYTRCNLVKVIRLSDESETGRFFGYNLVYDKKHYWGDLDFGWWMMKNLIIVSEEEPKNVAFQYKDKKIIAVFIKVRDKTLFLKIGDKIFEEDYRPSPTFHETKEWKEWFNRYKLDYKRADDEKKFKMKGDGLVNYAPIQKRGRINIETKEDLLKSAKKIVKYLSK